jgi:hypothetical protein
MKKYFIISIMIFLFGMNGFSQENNKFDDYFIVSPKTDNSPIILTPLKKFKDLSERRSVMDEVFEEYGGRLLLVVDSTTNELWGKKPKEDAVLLDKTDLNNLDLQRFKDKSSGLLLRSNFFLYCGAQAVSNADDFNFAANLRAGTFLLKDRWDIALSLTGNIVKKSVSINLGLNSKYYYPLEFKEQNIRISPYIGAGAGLNYSKNDDSGNTAFDYTALAGVSWLLGAGSLDVGLQYGNASKLMLSVGYTFFPFK